MRAPGTESGLLMQQLYLVYWVRGLNSYPEPHILRTKGASLNIFSKHGHRSRKRIILDKGIPSPLPPPIAMGLTFHRYKVGIKACLELVGEK